jgi:hypothetical protein
LLTKGFPARVAAGHSIKPGCATALCYAPGSAMRRVLLPKDTNTWLISTPANSSILKFSFTNKLEDNAILGRFQQLVLNVTYTAALGATSQNTGPFTLERRGSEAAQKVWSFIGPQAGGGKLEISGRAYWQRGFVDVPVKTVESTLTEIDDSWLKGAQP